MKVYSTKIQLFSLSFFILLFANFLTIQAQNVETCAGDVYMKHLKNQLDFYSQSKFENSELKFKKYLKKQSNEEKDGELITIPVVFHILHNIEDGSITGSNISDEQIAAQLEVLNDDFRRLNKDSVNTRAQFKGLAADLEIEFCLAQVTPEGIPFNGIHRIYTDKTEFTVELNDAKFEEEGGTAAWPKDDYLNIWVVDNLITSEGKETIGYAQFPEEAGLLPITAETDGVVIVDHAFGKKGTATGPYHLGRTATHEIGHWLNLYHLWGEEENCEADDLVEDTPVQEKANTGCKKTVSCETEDMTENYMDYSYDVCKNIFTQGQKERVQFLFSEEGSRHALINSTACETPVYKDRDMRILNVLVPRVEENCPVLIPQLQVQNFGNDTIFQFQLDYFFEPGNVYKYEWIDSLNPLLSFDTLLITLPETDLNPINPPYPFSADLHTVNNLENESFLKNKVNIDFDLLLGVDSLKGGDFENVATPTDWLIEDAFLLNTDLGYNSQQCLQLPVADLSNDTLAKEIIFPPLDMTRVEGDSLYFYYAYAFMSENNYGTDQLTLSVSTDCGFHYETLSQIYGSDLQTTLYYGESFEIQSHEDWREVIFDCTNYKTYRNLLFKITFKGNKGSNIYVDEVAFSPSVIETTNLSLFTIPNKENAIKGITVLSNQINLSIFANQNKKTAHRIYDINGRLIQSDDLYISKGQNIYPVFLKQPLPEGLYFLSVEGWGRTKFVLGF